MNTEPNDLTRRLESEIIAATPDAWRLLDDLDSTPELGFFEVRTSSLVRDALSGLGYSVEGGLARTGLRARLTGREARPRVAVLGELDALPMPEHPKARDGVAHACGHHAQLAVLYLVAAGLRSIATELDGSVSFIATPAEEFVDLERRLALREAGEIEFLGGKSELIRRGVFDDVDMALLVHSTTRPEERELAFGGRMNGLVAKHIRYVGRATHAAASPHLGVNALSAAEVALAALNAARETTRDEDHVRFSAVIRSGGASPNVLPDDVRVEALVRAASMEALAIAERAAQRAFRAGALGVGAGCTISTIAGYLPLRQDPTLLEIIRPLGEAVSGTAAVATGVDRAGSTDLGDLGHLMPVAQLWTGGASGSLHGPDFFILDRETAVLRPSLVVATAVAALLSDGASAAARVLEGFRPAMTSRDYLAYLRRISVEETIDIAE